MKAISHDRATYIAAFFLLMSTPIVSFAQTTVSKESDVSNCKYLETIQGSSGYGKDEHWQDTAQHSAMNKAEELGASNIVLEQFQTITSLSGTVTAKVYSCNS